MKHAKHFSLIVIVLVLAYGAIGFYFLPKATFQGELTRMALLPESLFGWQYPQPALDIKWMQQARMEEADVLVIGDSFSLDRYWQTRVTEAGYKVRTEPWDSVRGICADFMPWARSQGFKGRFVVMESIERNFANDLRRSVSCDRLQYHTNPKNDTVRHPLPTSFDIHYGDYRGKLSTGIRTLLNELEYERRRSAQEFHVWQMQNDVTVARIPNGCKLFSHAACTESLFFSLDKEEDLDPALIDDMQTLNDRLQGVTPIWVVVPNKSTTYRFASKRFWDEAERRIGALNLLRMNLAALDRGVIDLYPGNNTHYSATGYLLMGDEILGSLRKVQPERQQR